MPPLKLSDDELDAIMTAAAPLHPSRRDAFLQAVAHELKGCAEIGPGSVHRAVASVQRQYWDAPDLSVGQAGRNSKYR
jgi:hypothetical protein